MNEEQRAKDEAAELQRAATQQAIEFFYKRGVTSPEMAMEAIASLVKSNGCTGIPDGPFAKCCRRHDIVYETGKDELGNDCTREHGDRDFLECCSKVPDSRRILAPILYAGVRVFGPDHYLTTEAELALRRAEYHAEQQNRNLD